MFEKENKNRTLEKEVLDYSLNINGGYNNSNFTAYIREEHIFFKNGYFENGITILSTDIKEKLSLLYLLSRDPNVANGFYNLFSRSTISIGDIKQYNDFLGFEKSIEEVDEYEIDYIERLCKVESYMEDLYANMN